MPFQAAPRICPIVSQADCHLFLTVISIPVNHTMTLVNHEVTVVQIPFQIAPRIRPTRLQAERHLPMTVERVLVSHTSTCENQLVTVFHIPLQTAPKYSPMYDHTCNQTLWTFSSGPVTRPTSLENHPPTALITSPTTFSH